MGKYYKNIAWNSLIAKRRKLDNIQINTTFWMFTINLYRYMHIKLNTNPNDDDKFICLLLNESNANVIIIIIYKLASGMNVNYDKISMRLVKRFSRG